jgi:predicted dehydrogenase
VIRVGVIGFGVMGRTHLGAFRRDARCRVVSVATKDLPAIEAAGNIEGQSDAALDDDVTVHHDAADLIADRSIDAVSICVPTPLHVELTLAALVAGKHVLVEKPLARTAAECAPVLEVASRSPRLVCMPAMCIRFWPGWTWLRDTIGAGTYGAVQSAVFTRIGGIPRWNEAFYLDPALSGGAILDLHIHDADFILHCFGPPTRVSARGVIGPRGGIDHVLATYEYPDGPALVAAEGGWMPGDDYPFTMRYRVRFEHATAVFELGAATPLRVHRDGAAPEAIVIPGGTGYDGEVAHFLDCIEHGRAPSVVTLADGARAVALIEAERRSVREAAPVPFDPA